MNDDAQPRDDKPEKSWLKRLVRSLIPGPEDNEDLVELVQDARERRVVDDEVLTILEGALSVGDMQVREIMVPRSQMVVVNIDDKPEEFLPKIIESAHSRFPVVGETLDDVKGILLAKSLLPLILDGAEGFRLEEVLHRANIVPESKRLNVLLREFRNNRYHMAIVVDEYGGVSGLVSIEDILEEIVGEIEDETDIDEDDLFIRPLPNGDFLIKALTPIEDFNTQFNAQLNDDEYDTVGGMLLGAAGHLPRRNELITLDRFHFRILNADRRQIHLMRLSNPQPSDAAAREDGNDT